MMKNDGEEMGAGGDKEDFSTRTKVVLIVSSLLGLVLLYVLSNAAQVQEVRLDELENHETEKVKVRARVTGIDYFGSGSVRVQIRQEGTSAFVFIETASKDFKLGNGDEIEVTGRVELYQNEHGLVVANEKGIQIVSRAENTELFLAALSRDYRDYLDLPVRVSGYLKYNISHYRFEKDDDGADERKTSAGDGGGEKEYQEFAHFYLTDEKDFYSIKVKLSREDVNDTFWSAALSLRENDEVVVGGILRYSISDMRYFIQLEGENAVLRKNNNAS